MTVIVMVRVQYCGVKDGFWIQRATPSYFLAFVGRSEWLLLGWQPCRLVGWPAGKAAQIVKPAHKAKSKRGSG